MDYLDVANGSILFILCALAIGVVAIQAVIFIFVAWRRGQEIGLSKQVMRRTMSNSAIFSIVPSLPIIVMMLALSQALGRYFPWLRLSVVGSAAYEGMAADLAAQSMGLQGFADPNMSPTIFIVIMFVMTVGIIWGIIFNIFFMNRLDKFSKNQKEKAAGGFITIFSSALFIALLVTLSVPHVANVNNIEAIVAFVSAGVVVMILNKVADVTKWRILSDFSLPIALIAGMATVIFYGNLM
ncbi:DUF5058 family protein [Amphibacillus sp. Q70]|uniref:DUF5058 family protein n=1 Tax=Amphibacillus sp. Q70 TaxID=3453416 RepID=UPI003F855D98